MSAPIFNASSISLAQNSGTVPNVEEAMLSWFQTMVFESVTKTVDGFKLKETAVNVTFQGVWQPLSAQALEMKPEGQRNWKWFRLHAQIGLALSPDDVVVYQGTQFRVMARYDYSLYGYNEYHLAQDYTGAGP